MDTSNSEFKCINILREMAQMDYEEYLKLVAELGIQEMDNDPMDWDQQPQLEPDIEPTDLDQPQEEPEFEQPEDHHNDIKPGDIGEYDPQFIGKNYKNTKYYY